MNQKKLYDILIPTLLLTAIGALYIYCAPYTVQHGDTGELVTNSYLYRVVHPPGYPLFVNLYYLFTNLFPFGTIFFRASLFTTLISLTTLFFLYFTSKNISKLFSIFLVLLLATSDIFWRYSVLPDVFAFNCLFISIISFIFFKIKTSRKQIYLLNILFSLGLTNHHTLIFLAPIIIYANFKNRSIKDTTFSTMLGILIFCLLYLSILSMHPEEITSWDKVSTLTDLINHILRKAYGTFRLTLSENSISFFDQISFHFMQFNDNFWSIILSVIIALLTLIKKRKFRFDLFIYSISLSIYLFVFIYLANINLFNDSTETFSRFLLFPNILFIFISIYAFKTILKLKIIYKYGLILLLSINICFNFYTNFSFNNFRNDTIIEDIGLNIVKNINPKSILIVTSDLSLFSLYYIQNILHVRDDILVFSTSMKLPNYYEKLVHKYQYFVPPNLSLYDLNSVPNKLYNDISIEIIENNLTNFDIYFPISGDFILNDNYAKSYQGIVSKVTVPYKKPTFNDASFSTYLFRSKISNFKKFMSFKNSYHAYLIYPAFFAYQAKLSIKEKNFKKALKYQEMALSWFPISIRLQKNKCDLLFKLKRKTSLNECIKKFNNLIDTTYPY